MLPSSTKTSQHNNYICGVKIGKNRSNKKIVKGKEDLHKRLVKRDLLVEQARWARFLMYKQKINLRKINTIQKSKPQS